MIAYGKKNVLLKTRSRLSSVQVLTKSLRDIGQSRWECVAGSRRTGQIALGRDVAELAHVLGDYIEHEIHVALGAHACDLSALTAREHTRIYVLRAATLNPGEELLQLRRRLGHKQWNSDIMS